ncbi:ECF transporter S component [Heliobacterium gestii]|uniref:ECF transporter S component n=1 Tax=Heliomicrobium gestii TaxID=2699 RepID=A0A845LAW5_HELGE|nr:ECF transporter S component [Heliomicrobium gestii]MBM7865953.1 hypothetical protein [Heliomicrobium gestii]MZP42711.1 ECF transporter S component [Heliomicrobium gestii]
MKLNRTVRTAVLLSLALIFQQIKVQWVAGPAVNALLIIAAGYNGLAYAVVLGCLTPLLAFLTGTMPLLIAVPVIAAGNSIFCAGYSLLSKRSAPAGIAAGALLKFAVMATAVHWVIQAPPAVANALSLPQLFTALAGGMVGLLVLRYLPKEE